MEKIFDIAKDSEQKWGVIAQGIDGNFEELNRRPFNVINIANIDFDEGYYWRIGENKRSGNSFYKCTKKIEIFTTSKVYVTLTNANTSVIANIAFFDTNNDYLDGINISNEIWENKEIDVPVNAKYVAFTTLSTHANPSAKIITVDIDELTDKINHLDSKITDRFSSFQSKATLSQDGILTLPIIHVNKNVFIAAKITGDIESIQIGVGYSDNASYINRGYNSRWFKITPTQISMYQSFNYTEEKPAIWTEDHGLTLTGKTTITISSDTSEQPTVIRIYDDLGNVYEKITTEFGVGKPFIINNGASNIEADFSLMPRDLNKSIWCIGDSYFSFTSPACWTYYMKQYGFIDWLSNNQPGLSPSTGNDDLESLLSLGYIPKYVVWFLGMNGDTQESKVNDEYVINTYQKTQIDRFIATCVQYGIEPILSTIPTTPSTDGTSEDSGLSNAAGRQKTGYCKYVRSLGCRYIDFAEAVGADEFGNWNEGLLSSDKVHPTEAGAKVLLSRALLDCPELTIKE